MSLEDKIFDILKKGKLLKAKEIASKIGGITPKEVNSILYGRLKDKVNQNNKYQWSLHNSHDVTKNLNTTTVKLDTPLSKLSSYYLECISKDLDNGISEYASNKYGSPNYVQISDIVDGQNILSIEFDEISHLVQKLKKERHGLNVSIGYPILLDEHKSKAGGKYYTVKPLLIQKINSSSFLRAEIALTEDSPFINAEASKLLEGSSSTEVLQDIIQLNEELGLDSVDVPMIGDVVLRLKEIRSIWNWVNDVDPDNLKNVDLADTHTPGIYNACAIFLTQGSKYTVGLERELNDLTKIDESLYKDSVLGKLINQNLGESSIQEKTLIEPLPMNEEQRDAILQGLQNDLTVVTGPPGTGKSQVVSNLVVNAVHQGQKILFASRNNKAVDVVLDRVNGLSNKPVMLRLGDNQKQAELSQYLTGIISSKISDDDENNFKEINELHTSLTRQLEGIQSLQERIINLRNQVDTAELEVESLRDCYSEDIFYKLSRIPERVLTDAKKFITDLEFLIDQANFKKLDIAGQLFWVFTKDKRYKRLNDFLELNREEVTAFLLKTPSPIEKEEVIEVSKSFLSIYKNRFQDIDRINDYFNKLSELQRQKSTFDLLLEENNIIEEIGENSNRLWHLWLQLLPNRLSRSDRKLIGDYITVLDIIVQSNQENKQTAKGVWAKYYKMLPKITNILSCWAVTSLSVRSKVPFVSCFFDLVIIDEASQCDIASALPLLYRAKRAVIIGDDKQLTHISTINKRQDNQLHEKYELTDDFMVWSYASASLFRMAASLCSNNDIVQLKDHHRSHADIIGYSNKYFYDGGLRVATNYDRLISIPNEPAIRWIDVQGKVKRPISGGSVNEIEAKKVVEELKRLVNTGYFGSIGVVSPFRAQANRIRDLVFVDSDLNDRLLSRDFLVDTVHKFQGDERDVMIFSTVVSDGISKGSEVFLSKTGNLFNVAITRARASLIIVGDQSACYNSEVTHFSQFADHVKNINDKGEHKKQDINVDHGSKFPSVSSSDTVSNWEKILYEALYKSGIRTLPQYKVEKYSLDLALFENGKKLDIEVDGETYHRSWNGELMRRDKIRNKRLIELGWDVQRFWVYEIRDDLASCIERIVEWKNKYKDNN